MKISADQLSEILATLNDAGQCGPGDARRAPRMKMLATVEIIPFPRADDPYRQQGGGAASEDQRLAVRLVNLSSRGICILHNRPMRPASQFLLHLPRKHDKPVEILCTVLHCAPAQGRFFRIGAEFTCPVAPSLPAFNEAQQIERIRNSILD